MSTTGGNAKSVNFFVPYEKESGLAVVYVNLKMSSLPAHFLPRPQSLLCRHTGPAAPKPEGQCREGSRGSDDSQTSHLRGRTE